MFWRKASPSGASGAANSTATGAATTTGNQERAWAFEEDALWRSQVASAGCIGGFEEVRFDTFHLLVSNAAAYCAMTAVRF